MANGTKKGAQHHYSSGKRKSKPQWYIYHLTPVKWLSSKRQEIPLAKMYRKGNPCTLLWDCKLVQPLRKTLWRFLKKLKIELSYDAVIPFLGTFLMEMKSLSRRGICTPVYCSIIYNSQDREATWVSINGSMGLKNVVYIYNGIF